MLRKGTWEKAKADSSIHGMLRKSIFQEEKDDQIVLGDSWQRMHIISDTWIVEINFRNIKATCKHFCNSKDCPWCKIPKYKIFKDRLSRCTMYFLASLNS